MCGIVGIGGQGGRQAIRDLLAEMAHRGPDGEGTWESDEITLGHRRLAIIGLDEGGAQPMASADGRSLVVFNGEIYNYLEIADRLSEVGVCANRKYDTAVLLAALETWGLDVLPELNGMFAFAWYRPAERKLLLARDRWGKKPLFWGQIRLPGYRPAVAFSSELRTFTRLPGGPPPPNPLGVVRYLVYDGMCADTTVYRGVFKVPAASYVLLNPEGQVLSDGRYWHFRPSPVAVQSEIAATAAVRELAHAVLLRLRSDVPVGLFLSGGIDSSTLAWAWRHVQPSGTIRTFTVGFDEPSYDERWSARLMARHIGAEHHEAVLSGSSLENELAYVFDHLPEPFADPSIIPTSFLCRFAREHVKVALAGEGGDEIQAGYDPFKAWRMARLMEKMLPRQVWYHLLHQLEQLLPVDDRNMSPRFKVRHFAQGFLGPPDTRIQFWMASFPVPLALAALKPELVSQVDPEAILEPTRRAFVEAREVSDLHAQIHVWLKTYLESSILTKVDIAGMMHGLEVRSPFLDPQVVKTLTDLPPNQIFRNGRGKFLLRQAARDRLPTELVNKPKKGFGVPQAQWLRTILRDRMEDAVQRSRVDGWFREDFIAPMWRAHLQRSADFRRTLWNFLFSFPFQS
jgi:asparagine synthase (glutamine-hydrolysing)